MLMIIHNDQTMNLDQHDMLEYNGQDDVRNWKREKLWAIFFCSDNNGNGALRRMSEICFFLSIFKC